MPDREVALATDPRSRFASAVLASLVVLSPWAMGGMVPWAAHGLRLIVLASSAIVLATRIRAPRPGASFSSLWLLFALAGLGALQLVPLPPWLHAWVAPGSAALWHPDEAAANAVLGPSSWRPVSVHPDATWMALSWLVGLGALATLALPSLGERSWTRRLVVAILAGGLAVAVYGIVARVTYGPLLFGRIAVPTVSPLGPFVSKNHFAAYVGAIGLLGLGFAIGLADEARREGPWLSWVRSQRAPRVVLAFGVTLVLFLAVLAAQSRGGALALGGGTAALLLLRVSGGRSRSPRRVGLVLLLLPLAAILLLTLLPPEARSRLGTLLGPPDSSGSFRLALWRDALTAFRSSPLPGHGLGAFADALPRHKTVAGELRVEHAENEYVEVLVEGGVLGAGVLALGLVLLARAGAEARKGHGADRGLALGACSLLTALAVHSLVDFPLRLPAIALTAVVAVALLIGLNCCEEAGASRHAISVALVACLALLTDQLVRPSTSANAMSLPEVRLATAARNPAPHRAERAEERLREHLRSRPGDAEGWALLSWLRTRAGEVEEGHGMGRHAVALDPQRTSLRRYLDSLESRKRSTVASPP